MITCNKCYHALWWNEEIQKQDKREGDCIKHNKAISKNTPIDCPDMVTVRVNYDTASHYYFNGEIAKCPVCGYLMTYEQWSQIKLSYCPSCNRTPLKDFIPIVSREERK